ncbi:MAG: GlpM family protein, partial [Serratia inhibens]
MGILVKALIGALVVILIGLLAKSRSYYIAGLVPL